MATGCLTRKSLDLDFDDDLAGCLFDMDARPVAIRAIGILLDRSHRNTSFLLVMTRHDAWTIRLCAHSSARLSVL
jgi:hypothetical protein